MKARENIIIIFLTESFVKTFKTGTCDGVVHLRQLANPIQVASLGALQFNFGKTFPPRSEIASVRSRWNSGKEGCSVTSFSSSSSLHSSTDSLSESSLSGAIRLSLHSLGKIWGSNQQMINIDLVKKTNSKLTKIFFQFNIYQTSVASQVS